MSDAPLAEHNQFAVTRLHEGLAEASDVRVRHADGRQLQRVGIQPHIQVAPTLEGIRSGRDEVLERALAHLKQQTQPRE